jgi:hypothetical protein
VWQIVKAPVLLFLCGHVFHLEEMFLCRIPAVNCTFSCIWYFLCSFDFSPPFTCTVRGMRWVSSWRVGFLGANLTLVCNWFSAFNFRVCCVESIISE